MPFCEKKIVVTHKVYGITQDPETKNYMVVLNYICEKCDKVCNSMHFQQNFKDWTSGNNDIDKFIQDTQLSAHTYYKVKNVLEWIPYNRLYNIKSEDDEFGKVHRANWIDGNITYKDNWYFDSSWNDKNQDWDRKNQKMIVILKILNNPSSITLEFINKIAVPHEVYGITQDPETKNYMIVLNDICEKCNKVCNSIHFQQNFRNWTSGNYDVDKFIRDTQLSDHNYYKKMMSLAKCTEQIGLMDA
uniref:Uncharacterized protein n=1 Tax=Rhizophagus irregularis (strain DAOM 181602 / DAOM 197198 / MUCL 43194) TaxID=747089 RepID=U9TC62_RHIID